MRRLVDKKDPVLRQRAEEITYFKGELGDLVNDLRYAQPWDSLGLAAPQIGVSKRVVIANLKMPGRKSRDEYVLVNPVVEKGSILVPRVEKCHSLPDNVIVVPRSLFVTLSYQDQCGGYHTLRLGGINAVIAQHEVDHLDGKLIIDYGFTLTGTR